MKLHPTKERVKNMRKDIENRRDYIGGSDIGTVLGLNPYKSKFTLWNEKVGNVEPEDISDKDPVWFGTMTEAINGKRFAMKTGKKIQRSNYAYGVKEYPFIRTHVDFLVKGESAGLECKFTGLNRFNYDDGEIPPSHYAQVQLYMACTGRKTWYVATIEGNRYHINSVERNEEFIEQMFIELKDFWNHVVSGTPVEIDGSESTSKTIASMFPEGDEEVETVDLEEYDGTLVALQELNSQQKNLKELSDKYKNEIKAFMGTAEKGASSQFEVSWKTDKRGTRTFRFKEKTL